jgi:hypothetical protein
VDLARRVKARKIRARVLALVKTHRARPQPLLRARAKPRPLRARPPRLHRARPALRLRPAPT